MKTRLLMLRRAVVTIAFLLPAILANAQADKQATARIFESSSKKLSRIVLVYETGESEVIPLENFALMSMKGTNEALIENQKTINNLLRDMAFNGYEISEMSTTGESFIYTFIVFTKRE